MNLKGVNYHNEEEPYSTQNVCRLCLKTQDITDPTQVRIFEPFPLDVSYVGIDTKIRECTFIQIEREDGLPSSICQTCANKIIEWYDFKTLAKASDEFLRYGGTIQQEFATSYADNAEDSSSGEENLPLIKLANTAPASKRKRTKNADRPRKDQKLKNKPYCKLCGMKFVKFSELSEHRQAEHNLADDATDEEGASGDQFVVFRCHVCKEEYPDRNALRLHCKEKHNLKVIHPYGCSHCPRQFPSWNPLVVHERQHTGTKPYSCDVCGKANFISLASLSRHKLMHDQAFHCDKCGKDYNCDSALKTHIRSKHTDEKPFLCTICGRNFSMAATLNAHMTSHSNERKYSCDVCGFRSKTSGNHHRHMARHNKPTGKSFSCPTCGKAFQTKLQLGSHSIIHKSLRPHVCKLCGKGFIYKNKMETHILLVHAKERPYPCKICGRKLATKFGLGIHLKTHSKGDLSVVRFGVEEGKPSLEQPQLLVDVTTAPVLAVAAGGNLVLEEVKAGLLCFKTAT